MAEFSEKKNPPPTEEKMPESLESSREMSPGHGQNLTFSQKVWRETKQPGSAIQIILAAAVAIGIGIGVSSAVDEVPDAAVDLVGIPGDLWLRALKAVVLPLIITAMILAMQQLKDMMGKGRRLVWWTIGWYLTTTIIAIVQSCVMVSQVWRPLMVEIPSDEQDRNWDEDDRDRFEQQQQDTKIHQVVVQMFESFIPQNVVDMLASNDLLAVVITSIIIGLLLKRGSVIVKLAHEISRLTFTIITFLIQVAPIGVFFLILSNLFRLDPQAIGRNLGVLIAGTVVDIFIHLFVVLPLLFFIATRTNPYVYWFKCSRAWVTAWGTASSAATLSVTLQVTKDRGIPYLIRSFVAGLGMSVNMDGTAIYFPVVVVFMAASQGIVLSPTNYVIMALLATLASIGTTPIPSSSLVLTLMIAASIGVPVTGAYALAVAIDWFLDRFRTACNVSGDLYACKSVTVLGGFQDLKDELEQEEVGQIRRSDNPV